MLAKMSLLEFLLYTSYPNSDEKNKIKGNENREAQ